MKKTSNGTILAALGAALLPGIAHGQAQQTPVPESPSVAPQIELAGTGIGTLEFHLPRFVLPSGARSSTNRINVSDSALLVGISERLFRKGGIGSFVIGATSTESEKAPSGTDFFVHQLYVNYQARKLEGTIGRTDTSTRLIDFPTIRGDELNEFVNVLNPFDRWFLPECVPDNSRTTDARRNPFRSVPSRTPYLWRRSQNCRSRPCEKGAQRCLPSAQSLIH